MGRCFELDVDRTTMVVCLALANFGTDAGESIRPGVDRVAWMTGLSRRQVQMVYAELRQRGALEIVSEGGLRGGRGYATDYRFRPDRLPKKPPFVPGRKGAARAPFDGGNGAGPASFTTENGAGGAPFEGGNGAADAPLSTAKGAAAAPIAAERVQPGAERVQSDCTPSVRSEEEEERAPARAREDHGEDQGEEEGAAVDPDPVVAAADLELTEDDRVALLDGKCADPDKALVGIRAANYGLRLRTSAWSRKVRSWARLHWKYGCPCEAEARGERRGPKRVEPGALAVPRFVPPPDVVDEGGGDGKAAFRAQRLRLAGGIR